MISFPCRWFCHFDDDQYLNVKTLSVELKKYNSSEKYYLGHRLSRLGKRRETLGFLERFPHAKRKHYLYASGASYCLSAGLMNAVKTYFRGRKFFLTCRKIGLTDDFTLGAIIG